MGEWKEIDFAKVLEDESISYGIVQPGSHVEIDGIPIVRVQNIKNGKIIPDDIKMVHKNIESSYLRTRLKGGELLITVVGSVGECAIVTNDFIGWNVARAVSVARIKNTYDKEFIRYCFVTEDLKFQMYGNTNDTVQPTLNLKELKTLKLLIPELPEQKAIAEILSSLDDKIDLLHRQNKTLEQMAETLFRQWFVRRPEIVEGEEAKEDWEEGVVADLAEHLKKSIKPQQNEDTLFNHYSIPSYDNSKEPVQEIGKEIKSNKYEVPTNCILFSKLNPHKDKRVWLLQDNLPDNPICSTEFQIVYPKNDNCLYFLYGWLSINENYREIASGVGGTSGSHQRISPSEIFNFRCPIIPDKQLNEYSIEVEPIYKKQFKNQTQIRTLEKMRNTLLPKLMSGEVRIIVN